MDWVYLPPLHLARNFAGCIVLNYLPITFSSYLF
jgi:hypothetical protein